MHLIAVEFHGHHGHSIYICTLVTSKRILIVKCMEQLTYSIVNATCGVCYDSSRSCSLLCGYRRTDRVESVYMLPDPSVLKKIIMSGKCVAGSSVIVVVSTFLSQMEDQCCKPRPFSPPLLRPGNEASHTHDM